MTNTPTYIVAVSGGLDSACLLHMLVTRASQLGQVFAPNARFIVAHANHGIRGHAANRDEAFVRNLAAGYGLELIVEHLNLGPDASEEEARNARYKFLESAQLKHRAIGILLAHHQGDVLETAVINTLRGTGRRGLTSLSSVAARHRPILAMTKSDLHDYAHTHGLAWVEDESNGDPKYLRNKIRMSIARSSEQERSVALSRLQELRAKNDLLDKEIATILQYRLKNIAILSRSWFVKLPHSVASEIIHAILSRLEIRNIDREMVERVVVAAKVGKPGTRLDIDIQTVGMATKRSYRIIDRTTLSARRL